MILWLSEASCKQGDSCPHSIQKVHGSCLVHGAVSHVFLKEEEMGKKNLLLCVAGAFYISMGRTKWITNRYMSSSRLDHEQKKPR